MATVTFVQSPGAAVALAHEAACLPLPRKTDCNLLSEGQPHAGAAFSEPAQRHGVSMKKSLQGASQEATRSTSQLSDSLNAAASDVDKELERILPKPHGAHARIHEAMRYAIFAGGKRL